MIDKVADFLLAIFDFFLLNNTPDRLNHLCDIIFILGILWLIFGVLIVISVSSLAERENATLYFWVYPGTMVILIGLNLVAKPFTAVITALLLALFLYWLRPQDDSVPKKTFILILMIPCVVRLMEYLIIGM